MIGETNSNILGEIDIRVSAEVLMQKSDAAMKKISSIRRRIGRIESAVTQSSNYWVGDGSDAHRKAYNDFRENLEDAVRRFEENAKDLQTIARNYSENESQIQSLVEELPIDVIE